MRTDATVAGVETRMIIDLGASKVYSYTAATGWQDYSELFASQLSSLSSSTSSITSQLSGWSGSGDYTITDPTYGVSVRLYDILVNPTLADSLFQTS